MRDDGCGEVERDICRRMRDEKLALKPTKGGYSLGLGFVPDYRVKAMLEKRLIWRHGKFKWMFVLTKNGYALAAQGD